MSERRARLAVLEGLAADGLPLRMCALAGGVHVTTIARWQRRLRTGELLARRRGPRQMEATAAAEAAAVGLVRDTHGLVGAASLSKSVPSLSRRKAAGLKEMVCRQMERERRAAAERVTVSLPGVVRGFDAMELCRSGQPRKHALVAADGCVPFRTSWSISTRYDGTSVARLLEQDFEKHGPPLVLRMDRAAQHTVLEICEMLADRGVLLLQGPPHHAPYYGQLERQNRDHRAWLALAMDENNFDSMMAALNGQWRRRMLGWRTAAEVWATRPPLTLDRTRLGEDVKEKAARIQRRLGASGLEGDLAWRVAITRELTRRGLVTVEKGGWC